MQLPQFFRAADKWKAVLLLDEADIFLQARTPIALERNRLVGIFLQRLEHFQGVMILTTNRIDDIDSAVLDRLLLRIKYNSLDPAARYTVLRSLLHTTHVSLAKQTQGFDEAFLRRFAKVRIDGRQVSGERADAGRTSLMHRRLPTFLWWPTPWLNMPTNLSAAVTWKMP